MSNYTYEMLYRHAHRCGEIGMQPDIASTVSMAYDDVLRAPATEYIHAHQDVIHSKQLAIDATKALEESLARLTPAFLTVRAVVKLRTGRTIELPSTLGVPTTGTELRDAIRQLMSQVEAARGSPWADAVLAGPLASLAPGALTKLDAYDLARLALERSVNTRATAFEALYPIFLGFKEVVRGACGRTSRNYRNINLVQRSGSRKRAPVSTSTTTAATSPAPTNGSAGPAVPTTS